MKNIKQCLNEDICCGCGGCEAVCPMHAITMETDQYGFSIPRLSENKCVSCGKCFNVCPALSQIVHHPKKVYAGINLNKDVLVKSSSGGIFFELASYVLDRKGVVFGCAMDEHFQVRHIMVDNVSNLNSILKSKYVQSNLSEVFSSIKEAMDTYELVLFCGTPCQVSAIKNFVGKKNREKLILFDVVCHGVPSQKLFDDYLKCLEGEKGKKLSFYSFRYKGSVDNGMDCYNAYQFENDKKLFVRNWPEDSYNYLYMRSAVYRESCYKCQYACVERSGDITLMDYWGWEKYHSAEFSVKDSVSAIMVNTETGIDIINDISRVIKKVPTRVEHIIAGNGCLRTPSTLDKSRKYIMELWRSQGYAAVDKWFKKKNRMSIIKYRVMRHISKRFIYENRRLLGK